MCRRACAARPGQPPARACSLRARCVPSSRMPASQPGSGGSQGAAAAHDVAQEAAGRAELRVSVSVSDAQPHTPAQCSGHSLLPHATHGAEHLQPAAHPPALPRASPVVAAASRAGPHSTAQQLLEAARHREASLHCPLYAASNVFRGRGGDGGEGPDTAATRSPRARPHCSSHGRAALAG
jgi:hypothetical protein